MVRVKMRYVDLIDVAQLDPSIDEPSRHAQSAIDHALPATDLDQGTRLAFDLVVEPKGRPSCPSRPVCPVSSATA